MIFKKFLNNSINKFCTGPLKTINPTKFAGKLTILPTPIGNLQDLSPNIIKALFKADVIGCQDRRVAGKLYTLIKSRNIMENVVQDFGQIGLKGLIPVLNEQNVQKTQEQANYLFYQYSNMNQKLRKKFLRKMTKQQQQKFKIDYLKYRALKIMQKEDQFLHKQKNDKYDELYGIQEGDLQHIELKIRNTRMKKGRGVLIPLNTYSQTKMFNMVRMFLQTKNVAIISDAGMPCISDPGWKMVRKIRQAHPDVPIEVIGGPSSVSLMTLLASLSIKDSKNSISGRFQGFAPEQISQIKQNSVSIQQAKKKQFSIHFINSKKLRKKSLDLEKTYGPNQKILLANQLTKLYERKYHGTLGQLNTQMSKQKSQFDGIGQLSYLVYPNPKEQSLKNKQLTQQKIPENKMQENNNKYNPQHHPLARFSLISIQNFISSLKESQQQLKKSSNVKQENNQQNPQNKQKPVKKGNNSQISSKDMIQLVCSVFGIKSSEARKHVYQKQIEMKNKRNPPQPNFMNIQQAYKKQTQQKIQQQKGQKRGRRGRGFKQSNLSAEQKQMLQQFEKQSKNFPGGLF